MSYLIGSNVWTQNPGERSVWSLNSGSTNEDLNCMDPGFLVSSLNDMCKNVCTWELNSTFISAITSYGKIFY